MPEAPTDIAVSWSSAELRGWLEANHATATELWLGFVRAAPPGGRPGRGAPTGRGLTVREAVVQALCYGWIDGLVRSLDDVRFAVRFTPRRRGSRWSAVNVRRVQELCWLGLMRPPGEAAFERRRAEDAAEYT
jgi:uncharacterized protein YdeI (YjbR/CyaY-like superfamily)